MTLPQLGNIVLQFGSAATLKVATRTVVNRKPVVTYVSSSIKPTVQPANMEDLQVDKIDFSLEYLQVHSVTTLEIGDQIVWQTKTYKIVTLGNYNSYGFYECVAEEVKAS